MDKELAKKVFNLFLAFANKFGAANPGRLAFDSVLCARFLHSRHVGDRRSEVSVRFDTYGRSAFRFEINWPGIGAESAGTAMEFGNALGQLAFAASSCETLWHESGLSAADLAAAQDVFNIVAGDIEKSYADGEGISVDDLVALTLKELEA